jgi:hypothetical protein
VAPQDFAASSQTVGLSTERFLFVSPRSLSAYPLIPKAMGLFRKTITYNTESFFKEINEPYGSADGSFNVINSKKVLSVISDPLKTGVSPTRFRVTMQSGIFNNTNYNAIVNINSNDFDATQIAIAVVNSAVSTVSTFDFFVSDLQGSPPTDIYEISILVY